MQGRGSAVGDGVADDSGEGDFGKLCHAGIKPRVAR
jgi:hypothetical protein